LDSKSPLREKLVLASKSPRRTEILRAVGWEFETIAADIDETRCASEDAVSYVKRLAQTKAETVASQLPEGLVLGADTVVVIGEEILGQPCDDEDARRMLQLLNGQWHEVLTGVALVRAGQPPSTPAGLAPQPRCSAGDPALPRWGPRSQVVVDHETTRVRFCEMSPEEIDWYVSTGEPRGKAGAYAIQGRGALFIEGVQGDYFNVVGLPVRLVYELLRMLRQGS
jgi:septum formation protein